jgi:hypothetical protein
MVTKIIECRGSNKKIGRTIGEALREEIQRHIEIDNSSVLDRDIVFFKASMARFLPEVLEQMLQAAKAARVTEKQMLALNIPRGDSLNYRFEQGCSNVAFANGPDGPLWGKNNDPNITDEQRPVCVLKIYPKKGIPVICFTYCGWFSGADMMNAEGVATGHSSVGSKFQKSPQHVPLYQWLYKGMFEVRNVSDYANHTTALPLRGKGYTQIVVDRYGKMASGELACPLAQIRWPEPGAVGMNCVNHYQLPNLAGMDLRTPDGLANSKGRQKYLDSAIPDGDYSLAHMKAILRHHGDGSKGDGSMCQHGKEIMFTEYSMIGLPAQGKALFRFGYPCEGEYEEITF